jgi:hypothetical protein
VKSASAASGSLGCSSNTLLAQLGGQLVEPAEVDAVGQPGQVEHREVELVQVPALLVLDGPPLGVLAGIGEPPVEQRRLRVDAERGQVATDRLAR